MPSKSSHGGANSINTEPAKPCGCSGGKTHQAAACSRKQAKPDSTVIHLSNMDCRNEEALARERMEPMPGVERLERSTLAQDDCFAQPGHGRCLGAAELGGHEGAGNTCMAAFRSAMTVRASPIGLANP